jgi:hypothetical protein
LRDHSQRVVLREAGPCSSAGGAPDPVRHDKSRPIPCLNQNTSDVFTEQVMNRIPNSNVIVWTADPYRMLAAVKQGKHALESLH